MSAAWIVGLVLGVCVVAGFVVVFRKIGTVNPGRHAGREEFDWSDTRPLFRPAKPARPDRLDRLADRYWMPERAFDDLYQVDRFIAEIDAFLRAAAP